MIPRCFLLPVFVFVALCLRLSAAEYQWSTTIDQIPSETFSSETGKAPRAFLWIPPNCKKVRAIVIGEHNMEEEPILENPAFRKNLAELGFAEVWITPFLGSPHFRFDQGAGEIFEKLMKDLAAVSGYSELEDAPLVPMGHSAAASLGWDMAAWNPKRVLAVLSISGQWPFFKEASSPDWGDRNLDGVPGLTTKGEYEVGGNLSGGWYAGLKGDSFKKHPLTPFTQVLDPGSGHFEASPEKIALIGLYLKKAAQYRLPANSSAVGPVTLTPIDPTKTGWLFDVWHLNGKPAAPAAPVAQYQGNKDQASWAFDREMAQAIETFQNRFQNQQTVLIGYKQKDGLTIPRGDHAMVHLKFEPIGDGLTFKMSGGFWDKVPATTDPKASAWGGASEGQPVNPGEVLSYPSGKENKIVMSVICGPVEQKGPDTFAIRFNRVGFDNSKRSSSAWLLATWPGDGHYKKMVQQGLLDFNLKNKNGEPQTISFADIPNQRGGGMMPSIRLSATSSAHLPGIQLPVHFYVREGPAEVDDNGTLTFTPIPPRSKYPIKVTVVAWQWGRSIPPLVQSAEPVEKSFLITAP